MQTETKSYREGDGEFDVFLARPSGSGPHPTVLIFHAYNGRDDIMENKAKSLAELGYVGAAVDLYGIGRRGTDVESSKALMNELLQDPATLRRRIEKAFAFVSECEGVEPKRMGAIGFCFGGLCAILAARLGLGLRGVVSFHGLLKIGTPLDAKVVSRILVQHGQDDPMVPPSDVGTFAAEMMRLKVEWQLHAYPGVVHAFTNPKADDASGGKAYNEYADKKSWAEMKTFFEETLKSS